MLQGTLTRTPWRGMVVPALQLAILSLRFDRSHRWNSQRMLIAFGLRLSLRAFEGRDPVVFTSLLTPPELLHSLDAVPFGLEPAGAGAALLQVAALTAAERAWAPPDGCTVLRSALGVAHLGLLPKPSAVVCTSCLCDSTPKVSAAVARMEGVPFHLLDVPYEDSPEAVAYLADQMKRVAGELAEVFGRPFRPERMAEAIETSNRTRSHLLAINDLRRSHPGLLDSTFAQDFVYALSLLLGSPEGAVLFQSYHRELEEAARSHPRAAGGPRLLWLHLLPYYRHGFLEVAERAGATIVFEELNRLFWDEMDPQRPWESLARRCLGHPWNGPLERRLAGIRDLARRFRVGGAVHFSHHGCRHSWGAGRALRDALAEVGIPFLELEGDLVDPRERAGGQHATRLEAFIETLDPGRRADR